MDLYARAKRDNKRILNERFHTTLTITAPDGEMQFVEGFYIDSPLDIDPETGMPIRSRRIAAHVHLSDMTIGNPATVSGTWKVAFVNNSDASVYGVMEDIAPDGTLDMLSFTIKVITVIPEDTP